MKRFIILMLALLVMVGTNDSVWAQSPSSGSKTSKSSKKKKKTVEEAPLPDNSIQLPYNSNDCLFAIELKPDIMYGPTSAPSGAGRVMEVMADKAHPNLIEYEHNSTWYKFVVPYNGMLEIEVVQRNLADDYDFLLYKYTDDYFSNQLIQNKILPVAVNLSAVDTVFVNKNVQKPAKPKKPASTTTTSSKKKNAKTPKPRPENNIVSIGMKHDATASMLLKNSSERFIKSVPVHKGEVYYLLLDNNSANGSGHSVKVSVYVDAFESQVVFYDPTAKKYVDVDLLILERNTNNREIVKNPHFKGGKVKFVPKFNYTLYAKKDGYFSVFKDFNSDIFMTDTMLRFVMNRAVKGTVFPINDLYFVDGESVLLPESDTVLMNYVSMFRNHPEVSFKVKGYVFTYGVDVEYDQQVSLARAQSIKEFFVKNGIDAKRIEVAGMSPAEIKRAGNAAFDKKKGKKDIKAELIITSCDK